MTNAVLIDDEKNATEILEWQLHTYCPQVSIVAICNSADQGIEAIRKHSPDLLFLDIEMPRKNGFEVLEAFADPSFDVIFTTAYNQFAIRAFRFAALDYLLKPIDADDLVKAIKRYERKQQGSFRQQAALLMEHFRQPDTLPEKISFATQQAVHFVKPDNILYGEADGNYTTLYFADGTRLVVSKTLKEVEEVLVHYRFMRIHHSFVINMKHISRYIKADGGSIEMINGAQLAISRQRKDDVLQALNL